MRLGNCTNCLCFFLRFSSTCCCTLYNFASLLVSFLSMWAICISVHLLYVFSFPLLTALWRDKRWPQLLLKSGCRCVWGKPKSLDVKERLMKTVWKEGEPILVMPAWTLLKISLQQRERDPSLTWQELGKETSRSRQLATRKAFSTFPGRGGREAPSIWRGLARGTSPTCGPWWGKPIQQEYKERTGRILRELGREALFTWRDQEREILIQRQRRTRTKLSSTGSKRSDFDLALGWTSLYCFKGGISKWAFYQRQPEKKSKRVTCLIYLSNLSFLLSIFEYFPICKSSFYISCISWAYD